MKHKIPLKAAACKSSKKAITISQKEEKVAFLKQSVNGTNY